jgi:hypothetical protein
MTARVGHHVVLDEATWRDRRRAHEERVCPWVEPRLARRSRGERHPVDDFLFDYYPYRPAQLMRWHPGHGVALAGDAEEWLSRKEYELTEDGVGTSAAALEARLPTVCSVATLLRRTRQRPARFGCFGLHEWAMVYRIRTDEVRHTSWPLRLAPAEIAAVVDSLGLRCTHFDAYRFYAPAAVPLNERPLSRATQVETEQGGCLHATMDLYRWAYTLSPFVGSDLVADCFALARDVRAVDMRAAPYDLRDLSYEPIPVETADGRAEFAAAQREIAARGDALRGRLLALLESWLES